MRGIEHIPWLYDAGMRIFDCLGLARWRADLVAGLRGQVLARISHNVATAAADTRAVAGRTPCGSARRSATTFSPPLGPCDPPQRRLDSLATCPCEKCGLEVGCGTGLTLPWYGPEARVIGIDPDEAALGRAIRRAGGACLSAARVEALPFPDGAFDAVVTSLCFCSVDDPAGGLAEIRRVLRQGGELRMLEHVRARRDGWARCQDRLEPTWRCLSGGCRLNRDTEAAVRAAGFVIDPASMRSWNVLRCFTARPTGVPRP